MEFTFTIFSLLTDQSILDVANALDCGSKIAVLPSRVYPLQTDLGQIMDPGGLYSWIKAWLIRSNMFYQKQFSNIYLNCVKAMHCHGGMWTSKRITSTFLIRVIPSRAKNAATPCRFASHDFNKVKTRLALVLTENSDVKTVRECPLFWASGTDSI